MGLFDFFKRKERKEKPDFAQIVENLEALGYFKYAASADIPELKAEIEKSLKKMSYLSTVYFDESPNHSKDYRHHFLDGEDLFEQDGFTNELNLMKPLFRKMNFHLQISNHIEDWDNKKGLNHSITLNGKNYIVFKNFKGQGWGEAAQRFAEIINDQLQIQGKDERLFLANGGNNGEAIFLTEKQFNLLDPFLKSETDKPLKVVDWCRVMQVDMTKYSQQ